MTYSRTTIDGLCVDAHDPAQYALSMTRLRLLQVLAAGGLSLCIVARTISACSDFGGELAPVDAGTDSPVVGPTPTPDATPAETDAGLDADAARGPCALDKPFLPPTRESSVSTTAQERAARLSPNELELYLTRSFPLDGGRFGPQQAERIVRYTRATKADPWSDPVQLPGLSLDAGSGIGTTDPSPASMTFTNVNRAILGIYGDRGGGPTLYGTTRTDAGWSAPRALTFLPNTNALNTSAPWYDRTSNTLYMNRSGNGGAHVYVSKLIDAGVYSDPAPLGFGYILPEGGEISPVLTANELTMFFANNDTMTGRTKIYQAKREAATDAFALGSAVEIPELNPPGIPTVPSWVSADGCELYFDRESDIYVARKPAQ